MAQSSMQFTLPDGVTALMPGWTPTTPAPRPSWQPTSAQYCDQHGRTYRWHSRWHRKGRYPLHADHDGYTRPHFLPVWPGYPFGDISYWVGLVFTLGCVAWVVNGHYALHATTRVSSSEEGAASTVAAVAALVGGTLFEVGSWLLYWEALNQVPVVFTGKQLAAAATGGATSGGNSNSSGQGPARSQHAPAAVNGTQRPATAAKRHQQLQQQHVLHTCEPDAATDHNQTDPHQSHSQRQHRLAPCRNQEQPAAPVADVHVHITTPPQQARGPSQQQLPGKRCGSASQQWQWLGYRRRDIGFMAAFLQLIGATIFWVPCIFGTPGVAPRESAATDRLWDGVFWLFQCVGASFFIVSAWLFMLEEQPAWWRPQPQRAGWHVGAWNLVGSVGFWLSGFFGFWAVPAGIMQVGGTAGSTFWGSYAFLIGSYIQLLEVLNKHPERIKWTCW